MTIPSGKLFGLLIQCEKIALRTADNKFDQIVSGSDARGLALSGLVEGVANRLDGPVRYIRWLRGTGMPTAEAKARAVTRYAEEVYQSTCTAVTKAHLGVYYQPIHQAVVQRQFEDEPVVVSEGEIIGHVYAFWALSRRDAFSSARGLLTGATRH
jgi:hypothetical protein